jgi:peptide chain release factor 2
MLESLKCRGVFDIAQKEEELLKLEEAMNASNFWDNQIEAKKVIERVKALKEWTLPFQLTNQAFLGVKDLYQDAIKENDTSFLLELLAELKKVDKDLKDLEVKKMLSNEFDLANCYLSINAGAGGTEACDWAEMLGRMYQRWALKRKWKVEEIDRLPGEVAGIKHITFKISGPFAYGYSKAEKGVHSLVRISPFDSNAKRHTSFASVEVTPEVDEDVDVDIKPEDLRVDTYRSSGAGGQHVNTTDSAVRMTHLPTGIVVTCQNERSQIQNREMCMKMLKAKLYQKKVEERNQALKELSGEKKENSWGSQIRNYVFQPYTLVKDARTKYEEGDVASVMDGNIDGFVEAYLKEFG